MKKLAFVMELENGTKLVSDISDVELAYKGVSKEIRQVTKEIEDYKKLSEEEQRQLSEQGQTLERLENKYKALKAEQIDLNATKKKINADIRDQVKLYDDLGNKVPTDSLLGLRREYRELRKEIDKMDSAARSSAEGIEKIAKAKEVKEQINEIGKSVGDFREQVGSYEKAITSVFEKFGVGNGGGTISNIVDPLSGLFSGGLGLITGGGGAGGIGELAKALGPTGVLATVGASTLIATADYVADITIQFEQMFQKVGQLTDVTDSELVGTTAVIKTISEVYQQEFDEVLKAAQSTSKAFNTDIGGTLDLIRLGIAGGAELNNEFLDSLREYPRLIKEAGASQEQFFEILVRSTQEGIYSDKGIDLVKGGNIRLREQTKATRSALENAFGKTFSDEILGQINNGTITTFDGMKKIAQSVDELNLSAEQTGTLLADVFGGPGEDAGVEFLKILKDVDGSLDDVVNLTDAYTRRQNNLYEATLELNQSQANLASQFAGTGQSVETLGIKVKTFFNDFLDSAVITTRAIGATFEDQGILSGLNSLLNPFDGNRLANQAKLRLSDFEALREVQKGEEEEAALRSQREIERNRAGANGVKGLRAEQQRLLEVIQEFRLKGLPTVDLMEAYNNVTIKLESATKLLGTTVSKTQDQIAAGSLKALQSELSDLNKQIDESKESEALSLIPKRDEVQKQIDELQRIYNDASSEGIKKRRENEIKESDAQRQFLATQEIDNQKRVSLEVSKIKQETSIKLLELELEGIDKTSDKYKSLFATLNRERTKLSDINSEIGEFENSQGIDARKNEAEVIAKERIKSEEELQLVLSNIELLAINNRIQYKLDNLKLSDEKRLELEREYQANLKEINENNGQFDLETKLTAIDEELSYRLNALAQEVENVEQYEEEKKVIILESELDRLEAKRELLEENGESVVDIERDIALKTLEINEEKNKELLDGEKKRIKEQEKLQKSLDKIQLNSLADIGKAFGQFLFDSKTSQEDFAKSTLVTVLNSVEQVIDLLLVKSLAQEVSTKSFAGLATHAILAGIIKGALSVAKAKITSNELGGVVRGFDEIGSTNPTDLRAGGIFRGRRHSQGGEHFLVNGRLSEAEDGEVIINRRSSQKFKSILSKINAHNGWGRAFQLGGEISSQTPNVVGGDSSLFNSVGVITDEQMQMFANIFAEKQDESFTPIVNSIIERVIEGLDTENRLKERRKEAELAGQL